MNNNEKRELTLIIDIKNKQEEYAAVMEFISAIEIKDGINVYNVDTEKAKKIGAKLRRFSKKITFRNNATTVKDIERNLSFSKSIYFDNFVKEMMSDREKYNIFYYVRIHNDFDTDVAEIFYYYLMLQDPNIPNCKIITFIVPTLSDEYPYWEENDRQNTVECYKRFSDFTVFLPREYRNCYCAYKDASEIYIKALENKNNKINAYVPIIEINQNTYNGLQSIYKIGYNESLQNISLSNWIMTLQPIDCGSSYIKQLFRFANNRIRQTFSGRFRNVDKKKRILDILVNTINNANGITALQYIIFSLYLELYIDEVDYINELWASKCLSGCSGLSHAISQVLENIVNHSIYNMGLFAIRVHDYNKNVEYINDKFPAYQETDKTKNRKIEILIADTNPIKNIISTFLDNPEKSTEELCNISKKIQLSDFFGEYEIGEASTQWRAFKKENSTRCMGLPIFAKSMIELGAIVNVRSSTNYLNRKNNEIWERNYRSDSIKTNSIDLMDRAYIPGTQISALITIEDKIFYHKVPNNQVWETSSIFAESFESFSKYLNYNGRDILSTEFVLAGEKFERKWKKEHSGNVYCLEILQQVKKDTLCDVFKNVWIKEIRKLIREYKKDSILFVVNMNELLSSMNHNFVEPLCKGFVEFLKQRGDEPLFIMFTNCNNYFIEVFWRIVAVSPRELSYDNLQICLFDINGNKLPIIGGNSQVIEKNRRIYFNNNMEYPKKTLIEIEGSFASDSQTVLLFPFENFACKGEKSFFEIELENLSENELIPEKNNDKFGFKLDKTHMRLGNKVHIDTFYEMAPCFMRQPIAKRTAFSLLKKLINLPDFIELLKKQDEICFFGYASYSKAIVSAMAIILEQYIQFYNKKRNKSEEIYNASVSFALYQTKQAGETMESDEQLYYSKKSNNNASVSIIQVVPISSTLTTFKKMWEEIKKSNVIHNIDNHPRFNLTVLWVRDKEYSDIREPSDIERLFWEEVDIESNKIKIRSDPSWPEALYIICKESHWRDPISCGKCYPIKNELMEFPLIQTDDSSTIPSQQYYRSTSTSDAMHLNEKNERRVAALQNYVKYGHIRRGTNHYQYYIDIQEFFYSQRFEIRDWLDELLKDKENINSKKDKKVVIISPQRPNNIEFSQYVNNYLYNGNATFLSFDSEKHFRSNVEAENFDYIQMFSDDWQKNDTKEIMYVFVDSGISTGQTFQRIHSLMNSIVNTTGTKRFSFDKIFVLINRLSETSKLSYVSEPQKNYHSYVNLSVSNMRTYGDSCIGCKLKSEAEYFYKISSTKKISEYWEEKIYKNDIIAHHQWGKEVEGSYENEAVKHIRTKGYLRLMCSHYASQYLKSSRGKNISQYFQVIKTLLNESRSADELVLKNKDPEEVFEGSFSVFRYINYEDLRRSTESPIAFTEAMIKILCRPFFSFDYKMRCCMSDLLMIFTKIWINKCDMHVDIMEILMCDDVSQKSYILNKDEINWCIEYIDNLYNELNSPKHKLKFLLLMLKSLTNLHCNFVRRKVIISKINEYLGKLNVTSEEYKEFYEHYIRYILTVTNTGSDEQNALWLEHLLLTHGEYREDENPQMIKSIDDLAESFCVSEPHKEEFINAYMVLMVENGHIIYNGIRKLFGNYKDITSGSGHSENEIINVFKDSSLLDFYRFMYLCSSGELLKKEENAVTKDGINLIGMHNLRALCCLYETLSNTDKFNDDRYHKLQEIFNDIVLSHFSTKENNFCVSIIARQEINEFVGQAPNKKSYLQFDKFFKVAPTHSCTIKINEELLITASKDLDQFGFYISNNIIVIKIDNNYEYLQMKKRQWQLYNTNSSKSEQMLNQRIEPVYIYIQHQSCNRDIQSLMLVRKILQFRYQLIDWLTRDFNNETMPSISRIRHCAKLLSTEKAGYHSSTSDTDALQLRLMRYPFSIKENEIDSILEYDQKDYLKIERELKKQIRVVGNSEEINSWLLLQSYVNTKIARLYRAMVNVEALDEKIDLRSLYRTSDSYKASKTKAPLKNIGEIIGEITSGDIIVKNNDKSIVYVNGLSRKNYFKYILDVAVFEFENTTTATAADAAEAFGIFEKEMRQFNCIHLSIDNEEYSYCSEEMACLLLDYCFSAIKYSIDWTKICSNSGVPEDSGGRYHYLKTADSNNKCKIKVKREHCGTEFDGIGYDYLVLSNSKCSQNTDDREKKNGMSTLSTKWYIDRLWSEYADAKKIYNKENIPCTKISTYYENDELTYMIKLPILRQE